MNHKLVIERGRVLVNADKIYLGTPTQFNGTEDFTGYGQPDNTTWANGTGSGMIWGNFGYRESGVSSTVVIWNTDTPVTGPPTPRLSTPYMPGVGFTDAAGVGDYIQINWSDDTSLWGIGTID